MKRLLLMCLLGTMCPPGTAEAQELPPLEESFEETVIAVVTGETCHRFDVYLAETPQQQRRGLMFVRDMPERRGMLFVYANDAMLSMWMKNTFIPLDMLFIRSDLSISSIVDHTEPQSLRSVAATEPVRYVLELNAGISDKLGIEPGDRIVLL